jgi:hypothetical protein
MRLPKARIPVNAKRVEPGMYETPDRVLYINARELLVANGYEPSRENQLWIGRMVQEAGNKSGKAVLHRELQGAPR